MSPNPERVGDDIDVDEAFRNLVLEASLTDATGPNPVVELLRNHLGINPVTAAQCTDDFPGTVQHPVLQAGIDAFLAQPGRTHEFVGVACPIADPGFVLALSKLFTPASLNWPGATLATATWEELESGYKKSMRCLYQGMILIRDEEGPAVIWITTSSPMPRYIIRHVTVSAADPARATAIAHELRELGKANSPYRGEIFIPGMGHGTMSILFMPRPEPLSRDDVIMPSGLLDRIDQHAVGVSRASKRLAHSGQHLKRGLLLYGPPGTGKTHTIRYLISQLPKDTGVMLSPTGRIGGMHFFEFFLPLMGPSAVVVLDDVDVIAEARSLPGLRAELFNLLDVLDGLHSHGDVAFVLTTNRLNALEPAVAARPGRIDEALEVPRPDADCRRRLFALYSKHLDLTMSEAEIDELVDKTEGVTAAFTKELLRRTTVVAIEKGVALGDNGLPPLTSAHVFEALDEMLDPRSPATRLLLGAEPEHTVHKVKVEYTGRKR